MALTAKIRTSVAIDDSANKKDRTFVDARLYDVTMTGDSWCAENQDIGFAAHEAIEKGDVGTPGQCYFRTHGPTNYVTLGIVVSGTYYPVIRMRADEDCRFRLDSSATLYAKADTASCEVEKVILED
jgi:hypothetical protein